MKKHRLRVFRSPIERFREFIQEQQSVGIVIIFATLLSLFLSNFLLRENYTNIWHEPISLSFIKSTFSTNLELIINDMLMPIFFLLVGLEIKREVVAGALSNIKTAILPIVAAIGGMLFPAVIYLLFNYGNPNVSGWAIPTATDIAFALAIMTILGNKVPLSLKLLLTTLAVVDDLGAIIVIAVFYTAKINFIYLAFAVVAYIILLLFNSFKVKMLELYLLVGIMLWFFILQSGIHATIAGVMVATAIPYNNNKEDNLIDRLEKVIHLPVNFFILPLFAMCNTAIIIDVSYIQHIGDALSLGIIIGLVVGKTLGIFSFVYIFTKTRLLSLPKDINLIQLIGMAMLGGIGFTMSIFITMLAFKTDQQILAAKLNIMIASLIAGVFGYTILYLNDSKNNDRQKNT